MESRLTEDANATSGHNARSNPQDLTHQGQTRKSHREEIWRTKRVDYLYNNPHEPEAVVHPYFYKWESPDRIDRWKERCSMLMKRSYTYLAFLQHLSGKVQVAANNILSHVIHPDAPTYYPEFLLVTMFVYRQNLDIYNQLHPQLLLDKSIGSDNVLYPYSSPWTTSAPTTVHIMISEFSGIVNRIVHRNMGNPRVNIREINDDARDLQRQWVQWVKYAHCIDNELKWRARWVDEAQE